MNLWLAKKMVFEKPKDRIQVAFKDKDLYLMRSELSKSIFFLDSLKAAVIKLVIIKILFFLLMFVSLCIFPYFNTKYFKILLLFLLLFQKLFETILTININILF